MRKIIFVLVLALSLVAFVTATPAALAQSKVLPHQQPAGEAGGGVATLSYGAFNNPNYYYASVKAAPPGTYYRQAGLSPDGTKIVAQKSWNDGTYDRVEVVLMNANGTNETVISSGNSGQGDILQHGNPFWSDDGTAVGYVEAHVANPNKVVRYDLASATRMYIYEPVGMDACNCDFLGSSKTSIVCWDWIVADGAADLFIWDGSTRTYITSSTDYSEYEPVSNADGTVIIYWSGETTAEPVNTTHTLTLSGGTWTKDVGFTPISDSYWSGWSGKADNYIATTVMSSKDIHIYSSSGTLVTDLTGPGYSGGSGQWNFFGVLAEGPNANWIITSNAARVDPGRDIVCAASRTHMYVAPPPLGSDANCGTEAAPFATIQKGVDEVASGGTVNVAAGTYAGNITVNKSVTLLGDPGDASAGPGVDAPVVDGGSSPGSAFFIENGVSNVTIRGFEMRSFTSNDTGVGNGISAWEASTSNITIQDNYFHDLGYNGVLVGNDGATGDHINWLIRGNVVANVAYIGFELTNASNSSIEGNVIHLNSPQIGAIFSSARRSETGLTITDNVIDGTPSAAFSVIYIYAYDLEVANPHLDSVLIEGNTIATTGTPYQIYVRNIGTGTITGVEVHHNSLSTLKNLTAAMVDAENNYWGTVVFSEIVPKIYGLVDWSPWCNSDFLVCTYTWPVHNITKGIDYQTIQAAVDAANPGDVIQADAGTYAEHVTINKDLTLSGAPGATIRKPSGDVYYKLPDEGTTKSFRPIVLAYGGSITGGDGTSAATAYTIQGTGTVNVTLSGFDIDGTNAWTGAISSNFADGILLRNVIGTVSSNTIHDMLPYLPSSANQFTLGIEVRGDNSAVTISGNTVTEYGRSGILVAGNLGTPVATVTGNTVTAVYYGPYITNGIEINYRSTGTVSDNTVTGASGAGTAWSGSGIMVYDADNVAVSQNNVSLCDVGITVGGRANLGYVARNNVIEDNTVDGCLYSSIEIDTNSVDTTIRNNTITGVAARGGTEEAGIVVLEYSLAASGYPNGVLIEGNTISGDPGFWGIDIYRNADNVTIQNNTITGGAVGVGLELKQANSVGKTVTIGGATGKANSLTGQTTLAVSTGPYDYSGVPYQWTPDVNASGNWWGTNTPAGVAALVSANVDYTPWLDVGTDTSGDPGFQGDFSTLWVDDDSSQTGTTGRIQEGINLVSGSTVHVAAGTYTEQLLVQKSLTLTGAGIDLSIVKAPTGTRNGAPGATAPGTWTSDYLLAAYPASGTISVKVSGFTFDANNQMHQYNRFTGVLFKNVKGATKADAGLFSSKIMGFNVADNSATGVRVLEDSRLTIDHNMVGYTINGIAIYGDCVTYGTNGPAADPQVDVTYNTLNYLQPATTGYDEVGVTFNWGVGGIIDHNTMAGIPWGILVRAVNGSTVSNNTLTGISTGLPGTDPVLNNIGFAIDLEGGASGNTITNNTITSSDVGLVDTNGANNNTFTGNILTGNKIGAWVGTYVDPMYPPATAPTGLQFHSNSFTGNSTAGLSNFTSSGVDAELNWWGSACGPGTVGPGSGDKVSTNVDYSPWWSNAGMTTQASEGLGGELVIPTGATTAQAQAILDCASGKTVVFESGSYSGPLYLNGNAITLKLNGCTINGPEPAFTIVGDDETIEGPGRIAGGGGRGILVQGGADNFILVGAEVTGWEDGIELAGDVRSFKLVNNWIHSNSGHGLLVDADVDLFGVVTIEGNLFKVNGGNGIQHNGNGTLPAEYNSWGDPDGPAGPLGDGIGGLVDADPWTYIEIFLDMRPDTLAVQRGVIVGTSFDVALKADAVNIYAISFKFTYDSANLTLNSITFLAPWAGRCYDVTPPETSGMVAYACSLMAPDAEWTATAGTIATFHFTAGLNPALSYFDLSHVEPDTSASAIGGQKVFVNNAGFNAPSAPKRDIADGDDGKIYIYIPANYTGFVDLQGRYSDQGAVCGVWLHEAKISAYLASGTSASSGAYTTASIPPSWTALGSTYWLVVDRWLFLPTTPLAATTISHYRLLDPDPTVLPTVRLLGGDATDDKIITVGDLSCIGGDYGKTSGFTACGGSPGTGLSDVNEDGKVNVQDLSLAGGNLYKYASPWFTP